MDERLRIGILGLGMAGGVMAPVIAANPKLLLHVAADLDPVLRERFAAATGLTAESSAEALFRRPDVDVVYIATPHQFHRDHAIAAMRAGKHVVVEKPMAITLADCDAMIAVAAETGRVLIVGHSHGFDPAPRAIRALVESRRFGRLSMLTMIDFTDFLYRPRRPEELDTAKGGGIFFNQLPHQIEMARIIAAEPIASVRCASGTMDPTRPTQGHLAALVGFESGATASIVYSGHDRFDTDELCFGVSEIGYDKSPSHGHTWRACSALAGGEEESLMRRDRYGYGAGIARPLDPPPHQPHFGLLIASCAEADIRPSADGLLVYGRNGVEQMPLPGAHSFAGQANVWDDCHAAVMEGRPSLHDGVFARATLLACLALLQSAQEGREIFLDALLPEGGFG